MNAVDKNMFDTMTNEKHYDDYEDNIDQEVKEANKKLVERFPFLIPRNAWSGKKITEGAGFWPDSPDEIPEYDYEYTLLDDMPKGWRKAFGEQMCQELKDALERSSDGMDDDVEDWYPIQIKEKFGSLRFYPIWSTEEIDKVIFKYEKLSLETCIKCGAPATKYTIGWISPYCDECAKNIKYDKVVPKETFFGKEEE